jgi:hypothetical protein
LQAVLLDRTTSRTDRFGTIGHNDQNCADVSSKTCCVADDAFNDSDAIGNDVSPANAPCRRASAFSLSTRESMER